jgi:hypothetical protein
MPLLVGRVAPMHIALVYAVLATVALLLQLVQLDKRSLQGYMRHHWYARTKLSNASMCTRTHALGTPSHTNLRGQRARRQMRSTHPSDLGGSRALLCECHCRPTAAAFGFNRRRDRFSEWQPTLCRQRTAGMNGSMGHYVDVQRLRSCALVQIVSLGEQTCGMACRSIWNGDQQAGRAVCDP